MQPQDVLHVDPLPVAVAFTAASLPEGARPSSPGVKLVVSRVAPDIVNVARGFRVAPHPAEARGLLLRVPQVVNSMLPMG